MRALAQRADHRFDAQTPPWPDEGQAADPRSLHALAEENALLVRELGRVQARGTRWRDDCIAQVERLQAQLMRTRAEAIAKQTRIAALEDALHELEARAVA